MPIVVALLGLMMALAGVVIAGVTLVRGQPNSGRAPAVWWSVGLICAAAICFCVGLWVSS